MAAEASIDAIRPYFDRILDKSKCKHIHQQFRSSCHKRLDAVHRKVTVRSFTLSNSSNTVAHCAPQIIDSLSIDLFMPEKYYSPDQHLELFVGSMVSAAESKTRFCEIIHILGAGQHAATMISSSTRPLRSWCMHMVHSTM